MTAHTCHAIGCTVEVPPELLFCKPHWVRVPREIRTAVLRAYTKGQCNDSAKIKPEWIIAARAAIAWLEADDARRATLPPDIMLYADHLIAQADAMMHGRACCALVVIPVDGNGPAAMRTLGRVDVLLPAARWVVNCMENGDVQPVLKH